jgi:hypothetical protein
MGLLVEAADNTSERRIRYTSMNQKNPIHKNVGGPSFGHQIKSIVWCVVPNLQNRGVFLFGDDFNRTYRRVVRSWSEIDLNFALRRGFNMLEGFDQRLGASFPENIKSL